MPKRITPPITLPEYERLFRTLHAVALSERNDPAKDSLFFAVAGAYLLKRHHKQASACPVAGGARYHLPAPIDFSMVFGTVQNDTLAADADHFHCWIEADGWIIDLMAPLFDEMAPADRKGPAIPRFMFQKPAMAETNAAPLETPAAYAHMPNHRLTTDLINDFTKNPAYFDLVRVCDQWYARPPRKMASSIGISDHTGTTKTVTLSPLRLVGAW